MPRVLRYCVAAAAIDGAFYLTLTGIPYKAMALGATPLHLGLLPAVWSVFYITGAGIMGRLSDRTPRIPMARAGTLILIGALAFMAMTRALAGLFVGLPVAAIGLSLYWPALQAAVADADLPERLSANIGWFNVSWCAGKALGFAAGGWMLVSSGFHALFGVSIGLTLLVALFLREVPPLAAGEARSVPPPAPDEPAADREPGAPRRRRFLLIGWLANAASYGVSATLIYHYPRYLDHLRINAALFGGFLGLIYLSQTVTFIGLTHTKAWHYRRLPLYALQVILALLLVVLTHLRLPGAILAAAPIVGVELGLAYYSSIYYSLHAASRPGRNSGLHEAILGSGALLVPPVGGVLVTATGRLEAPYLLCAILLVLAVLVEEFLARRSSFRHSDFRPSGGWAGPGSG